MQTRSTFREATQFMLDGSLALGKAERRGIRVDVEYCQKTIGTYERELIRLRRRFDKSKLARVWKAAFGAKTNFGSDPQLNSVLYKHMKLKIGKADDKNTVDGDTLTALAKKYDMPEIKYFLRIRKLEKLVGTYLGAFVRESVDGIMRPAFNLNTVQTYRSSSSAPNFQNIPNRDPEAQEATRRAIIAREGFQLLCADFSGVEVHGASWYHKDPTMLEFLHDAESDMHRDTAMRIFKLKKDQMKKPIRQTGKNEFVFPEFYGDWYSSCAADMWISSGLDTHVLADGTPLREHMKKNGIGTPKKFEAHVKKIEDWFWNKQFPIYTKWKEDWLAEYHRTGHFHMLSGFMCSGRIAKNGVINYAVQGAAFHCLLWSLIEVTNIAERDGWKSGIVGQIHDEIVMEVHPSELRMVVDTLNEVMTKNIREHWSWIITPLEIEVELCPVNGSWYEKEEIDLVTLKYKDPEVEAERNAA